MGIVRKSKDFWHLRWSGGLHWARGWSWNVASDWRHSSMEFFLLRAYLMQHHCIDIELQTCIHSGWTRKTPSPHTCFMVYVQGFDNSVNILVLSIKFSSLFSNCQLKENPLFKTLKSRHESRKGSLDPENSKIIPSSNSPNGNTQSHRSGTADNIIYALLCEIADNLTNSCLERARE